MNDTKLRSCALCVVIAFSTLGLFGYGAQAGALEFPENDVRVNEWLVDGRQVNSSTYVDSTGVIHVVWEDHWDGHPDILYARSLNGGATFWNPVVVNDDPLSHFNHVHPSITVDTSSPNYGIHVVWADNRDISWAFEDRIYYSRSEDGGVTWTPDTPVSEDTSVEPEVTLAYSGLVVPNLAIFDSSPCTLHVTWGALPWFASVLDSYGSYYDRTVDCGNSFATDVRLDEYGFNPDVDVDSLGNPHVVLIADDGDVWHTTSTDPLNPGSWGPKIRVSEPSEWGNMDPVIAVDDSDNIHVAWSDARNLVERPGGYWQDWDIFYAQSTDLGSSFGANMKVNDDTLGNFADQVEPSIATDVLGNPHIAWTDWRDDDDGAHRPGGGGDGLNDDDVYYARSADEGLSFRENGVVNDDLEIRQENPSLFVFVEPGATGPTLVYVSFDDERNRDVGEDFDIYFAASTVSPQLFLCDGWTTGVEPVVGDTSTTFIFCVSYKDLENDPPLNWPDPPPPPAEVLLHVLYRGTSTEIPGSPFHMDLSQWIGYTDYWIDGAEFEYSMTLDVGSYSHYFTAGDATGQVSGDFPDPPFESPDVYQPHQWPMFRYDTRHTGLSPFDTSGNIGVLKWTYKTGDHVLSSPAIGSDGTIYVGSGAGIGDYNVYALNPDGTLKWTYTTGSWVTSSPAIGPDGTIYVGSHDYNVYALNPDGTLKWTYATGGMVESSPAIGSDGTIYVGSFDWKVHAINPDGSAKGGNWPYVTGGTVESSPAIGSDGWIYVGCWDWKIYAIGPP